MLRVCLPLNDNVLIVDPDQSFSILCFFQPSPVVWYNQATKQVAGLPLCPRKQNTEFGGMFSAKRRALDLNTTTSLKDTLQLSPPFGT